MATIQVRDIPDDVYETIRQRARAAGQSLQAYMRDQVVDWGSRRTRDEILAEWARSRVEGDESALSAEQIIEYRDAERR